MAPQVTLVVCRDGDETERLIAYLQRELVDEGHVLATELPPVRGTTIGVDFLDGRRPDAAERRVRQVLGGKREDWREFVEFA